MVLTYKRSDIIDKLKAKRDKIAKAQKNIDEQQRAAALRQIDKDIAELQAKRKRVESDSYEGVVHTSTGTYYGPGYYGRQKSTELSQLDAVIVQLELATDATLKIGNDRYGESILSLLR